MYEEIRDHPVKCRKDHGCEWCGEKIKKGDAAQYRYYRWEGNLKSVWQHPECYAIMLGGDWPENCDGGFEEGAFKRGTNILWDDCDEDED